MLLSYRHLKELEKAETDDGYIAYHDLQPGHQHMFSRQFWRNCKALLG